MTITKKSTAAINPTMAEFNRDSVKKLMVKAIGMPRKSQVTTKRYKANLEDVLKVKQMVKKLTQCKLRI
jgi:hypothetical protein